MPISRLWSIRSSAAGGKAPVEALQALEVPRTTLGTLVKRGMVEIIEEAAGFTLSRIEGASLTL